MCFRINERTCVAAFTRAIESSWLERREPVTSEFRRLRSRLNETSGGLGKIGAVSGFDSKILQFLRTTFLAAKLLGWLGKLRSDDSEFNSKCNECLTSFSNAAVLTTSYVKHSL